MILLYTFEGEDYPFKVEETTDDLANFLKQHFDKFDVSLKGKSSDIWNSLLDLDILDKILKDDRFEEYLKEYYKDNAYEDFLEYKEVMKDDEVVEEAVSTLGRKRDAKGRFASIKPTYDDKDYDRVQISAYNTLKNKKPYAVIYAYIKDKSKVLLNPPLVKNSQAEVDEFVNSFKKGKEATKVVVEVFYLSQLDKIERALKERGLIVEDKSSKPLKLYKYTGRAFNFEHELPIQAEYYVYAVSEKQALNNLRARIAKELDRDIKRFLVTLEDDKLKEVKPEEQVEDEEHFEKKFCDKHRKPVPLTDGGYCPICDDGVDESEYFAEDKNTDSKLHLKTILDKKPINLIYVYDDIKNAHFLTEDTIEEDIDKEEERFNNEIEMLNMTNQELLDLSSQEIRSITNLELIDRIAKLDKKKLSGSQLKKLKEIYSQKIIINREDVEKLIEELKECKRLFITPRAENNTFLDKYDLYVDECLEIIHSLNISDYYATTKNYNINFLGNELIIFEKDNVVLSNGKNLGDIIIYIKLDLTNTRTKGTIVAISFHQTPRANKLPYKEDLIKNKFFEDFLPTGSVSTVDNASILDLISEFEKEYKYYFNDFYFGGDTLEILIKGDWKHDHAFVDFVLPRFAKEKYNINLIQKDTIEHDEDDYSDSDNYVATHVFKVM